MPIARDVIFCNSLERVESPAPDDSLMWASACDSYGSFFPAVSEDMNASSPDKGPPTATISPPGQNLLPYNPVFNKTPTMGDLQNSSLPPDTSPICASAENWTRPSCLGSEEMSCSLPDPDPCTSATKSPQEENPLDDRPAASTGTYQPFPDAPLADHEQEFRPETYFQIAYESYEWIDLPADEHNRDQESRIFIPVGSTIRLYNPQEQVILTPELISLFHGTEFKSDDEYKEMKEGLYIPDCMTLYAYPALCQSKWQYFDPAVDKPDKEDLTIMFDGDCLLTAVVGGQVAFYYFSELYGYIDAIKDRQYLFTAICLVLSSEEATSELPFAQVDNGEGSLEKRVRFSYTTASVNGNEDNGVITRGRKQHKTIKKELKKRKERTKKRELEWYTLRETKKGWMYGIYRRRGSRFSFQVDWVAKGELDLLLHEIE